MNIILIVGIILLAIPVVASTIYLVLIYWPVLKFRIFVWMLNRTAMAAFPYKRVRKGKSA